MLLLIKIYGEGSYYVIDVSKISTITLNFGDYHFDSNANNLDKYIINNKTHKVYYLKGIELNGKTYYARDVRM